MSDWMDRAVTAIAAPELVAVADLQDANDAQLKARWEAILARTDLTPLQRQQAEKEYARMWGSVPNWDTISEGNAQVFAKEYVATAEKVTAGAVGIITNAIPWKLWMLIAGTIALFIFVRFGGKK